MMEVFGTVGRAFLVALWRRHFADQFLEPPPTSVGSAQFSGLTLLPGLSIKFSLSSYFFFLLHPTTNNFDTSLLRRPLQQSSPRLLDLAHSSSLDIKLHLSPPKWLARVLKASGSSPPSFMGSHSALPVSSSVSSPSSSPGSSSTT